MTRRQELEQAIARGRSINPNTLTADDYQRFERVRSGGAFNMLMEQVDAAGAAGLDLDVYHAVLKNYGFLKKKFGGQNGQNAGTI